MSRTPFVRPIAFLLTTATAGLLAGCSDAPDPQPLPAPPAPSKRRDSQVPIRLHALEASSSATRRSLAESPGGSPMETWRSEPMAA